MTKDDFIEESEYTLTGIGRLHESIVGRIYELRDALMTEVYAQNYAHLPGAHRKMHEAAHAMRHASATLQFQPQTFANTVLTVVAFQCYYLETRAIIDKFSKYDLRIFMGKKHDVDLSIMGAITDRVTLVWELFEKGVPVWYVRTAMAIPKTINIVQQAPLSHPHPSCGVVLERWPGAPVFYNGPRSPGMYFATGRWRPSSIDFSNVGPEGWQQSPSQGAKMGSSSQGSSSPLASVSRKDAKPCK